MFKKAGLLFILAGMSGMAAAAVVINTTSTTLTTSNVDPNATVFAGTAMGCSPSTAAGSPDCCATTGWDTNSALKLCTAEERNLAVARSQSLAIYLGSSCIQQRGICKTPLAVYCVFPDRVSYLVQKEGRTQLGIDFGTAASADCSGLTPNQIQNIDLTKIDFSSAASPFVVLPAVKNNALGNS